VPLPGLVHYMKKGKYVVDDMLKGLTWADLKRFAEKGWKELHYHCCKS
jgi:hypothetical protein